MYLSNRSRRQLNVYSAKSIINSNIKYVILFVWLMLKTQNTIRQGNTALNDGAIGHTGVASSPRYLLAESVEMLKAPSLTYPRPSPGRRGNLTEKNVPLDEGKAMRIVAAMGIDPFRPLSEDTQVPEIVLVL